MNFDNPGQFFIYLFSSGFLLWLGNFLLSFFKEWWTQRKDKRRDQSQMSLDQQKLEALKAVDLSNVSRQNFETLMKSAVDVATAQTTRADVAVKEADDERRLRIDCEEKLKKEIADIKSGFSQIQTEHRESHTVIEQLERSMRFLFTNMNIAYWEVDKSGKCTVNQIFHDITGIDAVDCHHDGWLKAVHEDDRRRVGAQWKNFRENFQTHYRFAFRFRHITLGIVTDVTVECATIMLNGLEVYKWTARTRPITAV